VIDQSKEENCSSLVEMLQMHDLLFGDCAELKKVSLWKVGRDGKKHVFATVLICFSNFKLWSNKKPRFQAHWVSYVDIIHI